MYRVIHLFFDLTDNNHLYNVGDEFPRVGLSVSEERVKQLSTNDNGQNKPLIEKEVEKEQPKKVAKKATKND